MPTTSTTRAHLTRISRTFWNANEMLEEPGPADADGRPTKRVLLRRRAAARLIGWDSSMLERYSDRLRPGLAAWGGRQFTTVERYVRGERTKYWLRDELEAAKAAIAAIPDSPNSQGHPQFIGLEEAAKLLNLHPKDLERRDKELGLVRGLVPIKCVKKARNKKYLSVRQALVYTAASVEAAQQKRAVFLPAGEYTLREAAPLIPVDRAKLTFWCEEHLIPAVKKMVPTKGGAQKGWAIAGGTIEAIKRLFRDNAGVALRVETALKASPLRRAVGSAESTDRRDEARPAKRRPGRPKGRVDEKAKSRNEKMKAAFAAGTFPTIEALARHFHVSRTRASKIVRDCE